MYSRTLKRRVASFEAVQKDASGTRRGPEVGFRLDLRPDFRGRREKWQEKKEMTGDGAREWTSEKTDFWAVATPLLAAFQPPNAFGAGGRYRPSWPADLLAPSLAELQANNPTDLNDNHQRR